MLPNALSPSHFLQLPLELRLEIYKFVLPAKKLFIISGTRDFHEVDLALLFTCKPIYKEAYPVLFSANNFYIGMSLHLYFYDPRPLHDNVGEVTFMWYYPPDEVRSKWNSTSVRDLFRCSKVHTVHIELAIFSEDEVYNGFRRRYQDEGARDAFLEHSVLEVLLAIPGVRELTICFCGGEQTQEFAALEGYMTEQLALLKSKASYVVPSKKEILSIIKEAFDDEDSDTGSDRIPA
ncbi:hypothetical protein G7Y89_g5694 [Cudoniella acicularis]|uniref:F-box domain-containing protein n=1 Tax=Cudoniella acicularis TaxID=354080 RepID=A0A8H4W358_9HELO|nr:hypothetical protein G7Y89_g5694 [Cudoniella acicularis]